MRTIDRTRLASLMERERLLLLCALNRRILLTPFHNMALTSPSTTRGDVDAHTQTFREALAELFG